MEEKSLSLYQINQKFDDLFNKYANSEISQEEMEEVGKSLAVELKNKSAGIIGYEKNIELFIDEIKQEEKRLADNRKILENKLEKFKEYVKMNMEDMGLQKIETPLGTLTIAKNPVSVEIYDERMIPEQYMIEKVTKSIDKKAIKEALQSGVEIQGARLVQDKTTLRIK